MNRTAAAQPIAQERKSAPGWLWAWRSCCHNTELEFMKKETGDHGAIDSPVGGQLTNARASSTHGDALAQRLLPAALLVPLLLGGLLLAGQKAGIYSVEIGWAIYAVSNALMLGWIVAYSVPRLGRLDAQRSVLFDALTVRERRYRDFMNGLPVAAYTTNAEG